MDKLSDIEKIKLYRKKLEDRYKQKNDELYKTKLKYTLDKELKECEVKVDFDKMYSDNLRKLPYRRRKGETRFSLHWGQLKLLLTEIEFLTLHGDKSDKVLYIGSADGKHIAYLSELFPKHTFVLYDPREFDKVLHNRDRIILRQKFFTDTDTDEFKNKGYLFISDIRNGSSDDEDENSEDSEFEENIKEDMKNQSKWVKDTNPVAFMLKFRLPYKAGQTNYFDGDIYIQPWAPTSSTEARLINTEIKYKIYDNTTYEQVFYRFNLCTRTQDYKNYLDKKYPGVDFSGLSLYYNYDLVREIDIIYDYLVKVKGMEPDKKTTFDNIIKIIKEINESLGSSIIDRYFKYYKLWS